MRRFAPQNYTLYILLALMVFFAVSTLQDMDRKDGPTYSQIRTLFLQERVEAAVTAPALLGPALFALGLGGGLAGLITAPLDRLPYRKAAALAGISKPASVTTTSSRDSSPDFFLWIITGHPS